MPSQETRADYHEGTAKYLMELIGEFVDEDTMKKIRRRAAGRAGGKQRGRNYASQKGDDMDDLQKRYDLGLKKADPIVDYIWRPGASGNFCGRCVFYSSYNRQGLGGECLLIEGDIMQAGWCKLYADIEPKFNAGFAEMLEQAEEQKVELDRTAADEIPIARSKSETPEGEMEDIGLFIDFTKAIDDEERTVMGIVLQPEIMDSQDDIISADEIKKSMYDFMETSQQIYTQHKDRAPEVKIVANWLAEKNTVVGGEKVKKGSWMMTVRIHDDKLWAAVKAGKFTGYSIRGRAIREEEE